MGTVVFVTENKFTEFCKTNWVLYARHNKGGYFCVVKQFDI